ncbi:hypothetical protein IT412_00800 [Candidatus Peregrinibacteria bacterium]|nr:hypothetical protein [Candidatus Peregrinibacteria bacterium]
MRIGLIDVDSKIVNLAIMKISAYHKMMGDTVEFAYPLTARGFDIIYASKIFSYTKKPVLPHNAKIGGTGYDITSKLPVEIEICAPDYSIYPNCDYSLQRFSIGCVRKCEFCVVPKKEGMIKTLEPMTLNKNGKWIYLLDNNLLASKNWEDALLYLFELKQPVCFEGIDIRIMSEKQAMSLNKIKLKKQIHIAWDNPGDDVVNKLKKIIKIIPAYKLMCYVLIGFNTSEKEDLYRVEELRAINVAPFVMPYNKFDLYQKKFARWVNHKAIFKSVKWKDYDK